MAVTFYVYSEGMAIISSNHDNVWGMATGDTRDGPPSVMIATRDDGGSLIPILPDGTVGAPIATGIGQPGGLTLGQDGNWYVGIRIPWVLKKVQPDGTVSTFKTLDGKAVFWYTWGPEDEIDEMSRWRRDIQNPARRNGGKCDPCQSSVLRRRCGLQTARQFAVCGQQPQ
jgi:hypothetical protein